jgi:predicted nucleic acid-binding protein
MGEASEPAIRVLDAYLVASAERTGIGVIASFDRSIDRVATVRREEPS